jgi:integrase
MLSAKKVERTTKPGRYPCGLIKGLLLQVTESGTKSWILRYQLRGDARWLGLGSAADFSLKEARERARQARQLLADGIDPLERKRADEAAAKLAAARKLTFREAAQRYFDQNESKWRSASYRDQFLSTLAQHVYPVLADMDVAAIETGDVLRAIEPLWKSKTITADRTRNRIEQVIDWAVVRGHRPPGDNPARWRGHLDQVLPAARRVAPVAHFKAMDYRGLPAFMAKLRQDDTVAARALEFLILTAARTGEVTGAKWDEINFTDKTWTVPADRIKAHREHRVPLSAAVIALLKKLPEEKGNPHVFIRLNHMALRRVMARMGQKGATTVHGFRSTFSNWAHEQTAHASHTIELSLAHNVGTEVERAYRRTDLVSKRAALMESWSKYCSTPTKAAGDVIPMRAAR